MKDLQKMLDGLIDGLKFYGKGREKVVLWFCCILKKFFALWSYVHGFHHVCEIMGRTFSNMCGIMVDLFS